MSRHHLRVVWAIVVAIAATPCRADGPALYPEAPVAAPLPAPVLLVYDWSGLYIGGQIGVVYTAGEFAIDVAGPERLRDSVTSFIGGGMLGYQRQFGRAVVGAEVSYSGLSADASTSSDLVPGLRLKTEVTDLFLATGKLGVTNMELLAYAKAGYATGNVDFRTSGLTASSTSGRGEGWTAGLGIDYAVRPQIILGIEYDYAHLATADRVQDGVHFSSQGFDVQTVMARLAFKFAPHEALLPAPPLR